MLTINKKLIKYNYGGVNHPEYIVIHETGNQSLGADAYSHYKYFNGGDRSSSAHYFVDDKQIIQCVDDCLQSWHNGKKYGPNPPVPQCNNSNSIGIEICVNADGDYKKAVVLAIQLTKELMKKHNIPKSKVIRHYDSCLKQCPAKMLKDPVVWDNFKKQLKEETEDYAVEKTKIELNGQVKEVNAVNLNGNYYIKLRDLEDDKILVDYSNAKRMAIMKTI